VTDYADLEKRLRERAQEARRGLASVSASIQGKAVAEEPAVVAVFLKRAADADLDAEAADALASLTKERDDAQADLSVAREECAFITKELEEARADLKRLTESLGIDKQEVVDDLKAWPRTTTRDYAGNTRSDMYVQTLMRQAAEIIETGRVLSSEIGDDDAAAG